VPEAGREDDRRGERGDPDGRAGDRAAYRHGGPARSGLDRQPDAEPGGNGADPAGGRRHGRPPPGHSVRGREPPCRAPGGGPPGRGDGAGHGREHRGQRPQDDHHTIDPQARVRFGDPRQADREQRRGRHRQQPGGHGAARADHRRPGQAGGQQLAGAHAERAQGAEVIRLQEALPRQQLAGDKHADDGQQRGEQPERDGLQVDGAFGVGRLGGERVRQRRPAVGQPVDLVQHRRDFRRAMPEPQRGHPEDREPGVVPGVERWRGPQVIGARPGLRRELGRSRVDSDDMEREWHRPGLRADGEGIHLEDVADLEMARLRQGERDIGLIHAAGVGEAAGQDLPPPEADGDLSGLRGHQRDVGWLRYRVLGQEGLPGDLRKPGQGRLRDLAEHGRADGRCGQQIGCPAPGEERGVGRIGPAGTRRRGLDGPGEGTNDQCQRQPRPPSLAQLRPQEHPSRVHGRPPRLPPTVPRHPGTARCTVSAHQECVGRWPLPCLIAPSRGAW
jgi:hypothetical protein